MADRLAVDEIIKELKNPDFMREYGAEMAKLAFAVALVNARFEKKLTQKQLAEKLHKSQPYIAKLEGGEANPTLETIGSLLGLLDLRLVIDIKPLVPEKETEQKTGIKQDSIMSNQRGKTEPVLSH